MKKLLVSIALVVLWAGDAAANPREFVYALRHVSNGTNQIYGFQIDAITGGLTPLPGFPVGSGGKGDGSQFTQQMAYASGRLYVLNNGSDTLSVFSVNRSTGALTPFPFSPIALGVGPWPCLAAHPNGSPVIVGQADFNLRSFVVTATTATPSTLVNTGGALPKICAFSHDGSFLYAGGGSNSLIAGFSVAAGTGTLTALPGSPFDSEATHPVAFATDSAGRLFVGNGVNVVVDARVFTTTGGVPTGVAGNPFSCGVTRGLHGVLHPAGFYMIADWSDNRVSVLRIAGSGAGTTLHQVSGSPFATGGTESLALTLANDGVNLVIASALSRNLSVFRVNKNTGGLQLLALQAANTLGSTGSITAVVSVPPPILGDLDGDRRADIFWQDKVHGHTAAWLMNGAMAIDSGSLPTIINTSWEIKGSGDFDANSKADVFWRNNATGANVVWLMNGLSIASGPVLPTIADTNWEIKGVGDFDANSTADIIWRHKVTGDNIAWLMDGGSVASSAFLPAIADTNWDIKGVGDFDADGKADVLWRHKVTGENIAWLMNGASIKLSAFLTTIANTNWEVKGVGDLDIDGKADVVWRNKTNGQNFVWLMNGTALAWAGFLPTISSVNWEIKSMRDLNGDGAADVVWRHTVTGKNLVWLMSGISVATSAFLPTVHDLNWDIVGK